MSTHETSINELKSALDQLTVSVGFIQENMLTKEEALGFATKDDLKAFATKDELKSELTRFATKEELKEELKRFATKEDLQVFPTRDEILEIFPTRVEVFENFASKNDLIAFKDEIITAVDAIAVRHTTFEQEFAIYRHRSFNHEDRLEIIEDKLKLSH